MAGTVSTRAKVELIAGVLVLALLVLGGKAWLDDYTARIELKYQLAQKEAEKAKLDENIAQNKKEIETRDAKAEQDKSAIQSQLNAIKNQVDALKFVQTQAPTLKAVSLPDDPSSLKVNSNALTQGIAQCRQCEIDKDTLFKDNQTLKDTNASLVAKNAQSESERDAAIRTVKGGTKWQRFKHNLELIGISSAIGALADEAVHRRH